MSDATEGDSAKIAQLIDTAEVQAIVARYSSTVDWMDWKTLESQFWPDAVIDFGDMFRGGPVEFIPFVNQLEGGYSRRMHMFGMPRIVLNGAQANVEVLSVTVVRAVADQQRTDNHVWGRYILRLEKRGGEWRISQLYFTLNLFESSTSPNVDEGPLNVADNLDMTHPRAFRG